MNTFCKFSSEWSVVALIAGALTASVVAVLLFKVSMLVLQVTKHGLILDFLSSFSGQVDFLHMEPGQDSSYTVGTEVELGLSLFW